MLLKSCGEEGLSGCNALRRSLVTHDSITQMFRERREIAFDDLVERLIRHLARGLTKKRLFHGKLVPDWIRDGGDETVRRWFADDSRLLDTSCTDPDAELFQQFDREFAEDAAFVVSHPSSNCALD